MIAAAFTHYQKGENSLVISELKRAYNKLGNFSGTYQKIEMESLKSKILYLVESDKVETFKI